MCRVQARIGLLALSVLLAIGCASAPPPPPPPPPAPPEPMRIEGRVLHPQGARVPPGSEARVALVEVTAGTAAATTLVQRAFPIAQQLPVPFSLAIDPKQVSGQGRYELRAVVADAKGNPTWYAQPPVPWLPAPKTEFVALVVEAPRPPDLIDASPIRYRCDASFRFGLQPMGDDVEVRLADRTLRMSRVPSVLGQTWTDGVNTFWSKEGIANLTIAGRVHNCYQRYP